MAPEATYNFFREFRDPFFNIAGNVDVTEILRLCRDERLSVSLAILYCSLIAANSIDEFRVRLLDGQLVEFERVHATQTILNDDDTFSFAYFELQENLAEFDRSGKLAAEKYKQLRSFDVESDRIDLIYYSVVPWISFTSIKHASQLDNSQTVPRIVFGKIFSDRDRMLMPVSVEANHAIMDGVHVGKFFDRFQRSLNSSTDAFE